MMTRKGLEHLAAEHYKRLTPPTIAAWAWHIPTHRVTWTPEMYALLGLPLGSGSEDFDYAMSFLTPDCQALMRNALQHALMQDGGNLNMLVTAPHPSGDFLQLQVVARVMYANGAPSVMEGYATPVAAQKTA